MSIIRKISVGRDPLNGSMHYQIGKKFEVLGELFEVCNILEEVKDGKVRYNIYIKGEDNTFIWKTIIDMPTQIEYNITFQ